ncbi:MAG: hypothetical protein JSR47_10275 [Proteobacteria bacterium]|nr:hypothetical protein [Pseudomonadota bacterium]
MMKFLPFIAATLLALPAAAQVDCNAGMEPIDRTADFALTASDFVKSIATNEQKFSKALGGFSYDIDIKVETLDGDTVDGEYHRASKMAFEGGTRRQTVADGAVNTLKRLKLSDRDIAVLGDPASYILDGESFANRDIVYSGRQKMADHNYAIFDALPRSSVSAETGHGFEGRTWVRGRYRAIAKTCGRSNDFPVAFLRFSTLREPVAETNYFPVLVMADETMPIDNAQVHVRVTVKFSNYRAKP